MASIKEKIVWSACLVEFEVLFSGQKKVQCTKQKIIFELGEEIHREQFCE
jgi:uncharacterized protein YbbK (DUF523 family)